MGWDTSTSTAELHFDGRRHTTAEWVVTNLEALEYAYNIAAMVHLIDEGGYENLQDLNSDLRVSAQYGLSTMNLLLRRNLFAEIQLHVAVMESTNSFTVEFGGLAKVVQALGAIFDPLSRKTRREQLRHDMAMNRLDEEDRITEVAARRLDLLMTAMSDPHSAYTHRVKTLGATEAAEFNALLQQEFERAVKILGLSDVQIIQRSAIERRNQA